MSFPDIVPALKEKMPELRGRLLANQSLAEFAWFRVGGRAQVFYLPEDENDLGYFLQNLPADIPVTVVGAGSNLIVRDGGVPGVVVRLGRGFNEIKIEDNTSRHRRRGAARRSGRARGAGRRHRRACFLERHSRHHRRRIAHEWRRLWRRDQGRARRSARCRPQGQPAHLQQWRNGIFLSPLRRAGRCHFHWRGVSGPRRKPGGNCRRNGVDQNQAREDAAAQSHRRLHFQEPAEHERLETGGRGRLPRPHHWGCAGLDCCTAIS